MSHYVADHSRALAPGTLTPTGPLPDRALGSAARILGVVIFFEVLLALVSLLILWFAVYVVYRLVTDES